jgi:hypothetical protein
MDHQYMTKMATSFLAELTEIEKQSFAPIRFLTSGVKHIGKGLSQVGKSGGGRTMALGGRGAVRAGGVMPHMKQIWGAGADRAALAGKGRFMGGLGTLARSRYGQMAGAAAVPVAAGYGIHAMRS